MDDLSRWYEVAKALKTQGKSHLIDDTIPEEFLEPVKERLNSKVITSMTTHTITNKDDLYWCDSDSRDSTFWDSYQNVLLNKKWNVKPIDESSDKILRLLPNPKKEQFTSHGLVIGHVQSGKTANFSAVLTKAADAGYNFFIIIAGIYNDLRTQTQNRLNDEIINPNPRYPIGKRWIKLTDKDDFNDERCDIQLLQEDSVKIMVIKKRYETLIKLYNWLERASNENLLDNKKVIIVDDEADLATINTSKKSDVDDEEDCWDEFEDDIDATITNEYIRRIRNVFKSVAYLGYTATPFANILIEPFEKDPDLGQTLYPRNFIASLPKPKGYFGLEEVFGDESSYRNVELINKTDRETLTSNEIPMSLQMAICDFIIIDIIMEEREIHKDFHSMMIHFHHETKYQIDISETLKDELNFMKWELKPQGEYYEIFKNRLEQYYKNCDDAKIDESINKAINIIKKIKVKIINSDRSQGQSLDFSKPKNKKYYIVVGGNRLSRGLTIEGLVVSYFLRPSTTYDTLMQMGRWFGYRIGYEDLIKVYMTIELYSWFQWLYIVEEGIREDIARYDKYNKSPEELAVRIKTHPQLNPTSRGKMRRTSVKHSHSNYDCRVVETKEFNFDDVESFKENLSKFQQFFYSIFNSKHYDSSCKDGYLFRGVFHDIIINFLNKMSYPNEYSFFDTKNIVKYIEKKVSNEELVDWTVYIASNSKAKNVFNIIDECEIGLSERSKEIGASIINTISDPRHFAYDLEKTKISENGMVDMSFYSKKTNNGYKPETSRIIDSRNPKNPIMLIYLVDKDSVPKKGYNNRSSLFTGEQEKEHIVMLSIMFPKSNTHESGYSYVQLKAVEGEVEDNED